MVAQTSVEFLAYLIFPWALAAIWRASTAAKLLFAAVLVASLIVLWRVSGDDFDQWDCAKAFLRCVPEFLGGILLYNAFCSGPGRRWLASDATAVIVFATAIALAQTGVSDFLTVLAFALLIPVSVANEGLITRLLNVGPLIWLGEISYSLYLVHGFVQFAAGRLLAAKGIDPGAMSQSASALLTGAMLLCSFPIAALTYATVERAGWRRLRHVFGVGGPAPSPA